MYIDPSGEIAIATIILIAAIVAGTGAFTYTAVTSYNDTGEADWLGATVTGLAVFAATYSLGMYAYSSYMTFAIYYGWNPVVGIGAGGLQYMYNFSNSSQSPNYYVTPSGAAIPSNKTQLNSNLTKFDVSNNKYYGTDSHGSLRIRFEQHSNNTTFTGIPSPYHCQPHLHIDRRINGITGSWYSETTLSQNIFD